VDYLNLRVAENETQILRLQQNLQVSEEASGTAAARLHAEVTKIEQKYKDEIEELKVENVRVKGELEELVEFAKVKVGHCVRVCVRASFKQGLIPITHNLHKCTGSPGAEK
jgi:hypothetical protein